MLKAPTTADEKWVLENPELKKADEVVYHHPSEMEEGVVSTPKKPLSQRRAQKEVADYLKAPTQAAVVGKRIRKTTKRLDL